MEHWEPHTVTTSELIDPAPVAALAALLDDGLPAPGAGEELPPLWHWVALPRWPGSTELGQDSHPVRGTFLPPVDLPRRMFAGGEVILHRPLTVGATVTRSTEVESVTEKSGRSGRLAIVVVRARLSTAEGECAIEERQDLIYRERGARVATREPPPPSPGAPLRRVDERSWDFLTDPSLLMRFSAATANAHRIHYDWPYATRIEGYPGLVVHGPLMSIALAEVLRLDRPGDRVARLNHRNKGPLYCGEPATVRANERSLDLLGPGGTCTSIEVDIRQDDNSHT